MSRFVWPPRPAASAPDETLRDGVRHPDPPRDASIDERPRRGIAPAPGKESALLQIERTWLGLIAPPLPIRMAEAGWAPDAWTEYCQRCGQTAGPHDSDDTGCSICRKHRLPWERLVRLGDFAGLLREMVLEVKFQRWRRLGDDLGQLLGRAVGESLDRANVPRSTAAIVPVASTWRRRTFRGIDHALVIARGVGTALGAPVVPALSRLHRPSQTSLPRSDRLANVSGSFRLRPMFGYPLAGRTVVLVDDVTTTRATLRAAAKAIGQGLKSEGANSASPGTRVWAAVLAVTPESGRKPLVSQGSAGIGMSRS